MRFPTVGPRLRSNGTDVFPIIVTDAARLLLAKYAAAYIPIKEVPTITACLPIAAAATAFASSGVRTT